MPTKASSLPVPLPHGWLSVILIGNFIYLLMQYSLLKISGYIQGVQAKGSYHKETAGFYYIRFGNTNTWDAAILTLVLPELNVKSAAMRIAATFFMQEPPLLSLLSSETGGRTR